MMAEIKKDPRNYRLHDENNKQLIKQSLAELGAGRSILLDGEDYIIAGNGVFEQAEKLGIPVKVIETDGTELVAVKRTDLKLDDERRRELALADNATSDSSLFDFELLAEDWSQEGLEKWGIDLSEWGEGAEVKDDDFSGAIPKQAKTVLGDLYELHSTEAGLVHRVQCGDSTAAESTGQVLNGSRINLVVSSPPYFNQRDYSFFKSLEEYEDFILNTAAAFFGFLDEQAVVFWNCGNGEADNYDISALNSIQFLKIGLKFTDKIVWKKAGGVFDIPRSQHIENFRYFPAFAYELCYVYRKTTLPQFEKSDKKFARKNQLNIWEIKQVRTNKESDNEGHPAQFPIELPARSIRLYSTKKKNIYDPFLGSGTTLIAAEQLQRHCFGQEISPVYCDVIAKRWVKYMLDNDLDFKVLRNGEDISEEHWLIENN